MTSQVCHIHDDTRSLTIKSTVAFQWQGSQNSLLTATYVRQLLHFHGSNGFSDALQCYILRTLPILVIFLSPTMLLWV